MFQSIKHFIYRIVGFVKKKQRHEGSNVATRLDELFAELERESNQLVDEELGRLG
jgi:hypothetical protein